MRPFHRLTGPALIAAVAILAIVAARHENDPRTRLHRLQREIVQEHREHPERFRENRERTPVPPGTPRYALARSGSARFDAGYGEGGFFLYDARHASAGADDGVGAIDAELRSRAGAAVHHGVAFVEGCCADNDAPVRVVLRDRAPAHVARRGWDAITDFDLPARSGRLLYVANGDPTPYAVLEVPAGRYRARVSDHGADGADAPHEHFRIELWPARAARGAVARLRR